ncbi:MAG: hypothetical protein JXR34_12120 [Bacteroidales bacterium]|nr:hypothetical protein [Bacteroidales bacterium]
MEVITHFFYPVYPKGDSVCRELSEYLYTLCHEDLPSKGHKKGLRVSAT